MASFGAIAPRGSTAPQGYRRAPRPTMDYSGAGYGSWQGGWARPQLAGYGDAAPTEVVWSEGPPDIVAQTEGKSKGAFWSTVGDIVQAVPGIIAALGPKAQAAPPPPGYPPVMNQPAGPPQWFWYAGIGVVVLGGIVLITRAR